MARTKQFREVGSVRPSHLMFTGGIGSIIDLPNFSVLVGGLNDWEPQYRDDPREVHEPRLLEALRRNRSVGRSLGQLRLVPVTGEDERTPIGVPVRPFPSWFRCTACNRLAPLHDPSVEYVNRIQDRPDKAVFEHKNCPRGGRRKQPRLVPARFVLVCRQGHLDDFPYSEFVHRGAPCPSADHPMLVMNDRAGNRAVNVKIECLSCGQDRNLRDAMGERGRANLPLCRGRHPHLRQPDECAETPYSMVVGASNLWFPQTLSVLSVPPDAADQLAARVAEHWETLTARMIHTFPVEALAANLELLPPPLREYEAADILAAIRAHQPGREERADTDLLEPEWKTFTAATLPRDESFDARREPGGVHRLLKPYFTDLVRAERLKVVRAFYGFTRLDAPDPEEPDLVPTAPISRDRPDWLPASEVFGEGIFLRVDADALAAWARKVEASEPVRRLKDSWGRFRAKRHSGRTGGEFDPTAGWPGPGYLALHTLSHLLIRTIALECGYSAASLAERIYSNGEDRAGILIYTAVPDAEGTLGGLVSLADPQQLTRIVRRALTEAESCSGDPVCAGHLPAEPEDTLHGAACHSCLFVSETTCERGNRFLDRRFVVDLGDELSFFPPWRT